MFIGLILSVCAGAGAPPLAANMHGGWIGGQCRLATSTIARSLGNAGLAAADGRIDAGYDAHRQSVFLKTEREGLNCSNGKQPTGETDARPRLSRKRPQLGRTDSLQ